MTKYLLWQPGFERDEFVQAAPPFPPGGNPPLGPLDGNSPFQVQEYFQRTNTDQTRFHFRALDIVIEANRELHALEIETRRRLSAIERDKHLGITADYQAQNNYNGLFGPLPDLLTAIFGYRS